MRALILLVLSTYPSQSWAATPCTEQDYSDSDKSPIWSCPGPDEAILLPDVTFRPSVGLSKGGVYRQAIHTGTVTLNYPAVLMDRDRVIHLGLKIKALRKLRWLDRHRGAKILQIEKRYVADRMLAQVNLEKARVSTCKNQRDEARKWYRSWTFGFVVGVVTVATATAATVVFLQ